MSLTFKYQDLSNKWKSKFNIVDFGHTNEMESTSWHRFKFWINKGHAGILNYLTDHRADLRKNLKNYWPEAQSSLTFLFSYHDAAIQLKNLYQNDPNWNGLKIASYTVGFADRDYHFQIASYLTEIAEDLKLHSLKNLEYKLALDIHPVLERDLAYRCGLGFFGKNSMLISPKYGSFFIIGSIIFNQKIEADAKIEIKADHCGHCRRCIDACPTNAIIEDSRTLLANKCIATYTIESNKRIESIENELIAANKLTPYTEIFGCDICQSVCPFNNRVEKIILRNGLVTKVESKMVRLFLLTPRDKIISFINTLSQTQFKKFFHESSFLRSQKKGLLKNFFSN